MKRLLLLILLTLSIISCKYKGGDKAGGIKLFEGFIRSDIPNTSYVISLPPGYKIIEERGADFSVYNITRKDSTVRSGFSAGLYLGNFPSKFAMPESCKTNMLKSLILKDSAQWDIYNCKDTLFVQTLINDHHKHQWYQQIHAWGNATTKAGIDTVLYVYSTLQAKE